MNQHRRAFLKQMAALSGMGAAAPLAINLGALTEAAAQSAGGGYKALVCIFLNGGNDAFNTVLATDSTSWTHYTAHRTPADSSAGIALPVAGTAADSAAGNSDPARLGGILPIDHANRAVHSGRTFALHPALTGLRGLYQSGQAAVLANVGPLLSPTTKANYTDPTVAKPAKLFSHNDQQSTWQSFQPEGASEGWGGLMGDCVMAANGASRNEIDAAIIRRSFTCMSPSGTSVWLAGKSVLPYQSGSSSVMSLGSGGKVYGQAAVLDAMAAVLGKASSDGSYAVPARNLLHADHQQVVQRALQAADLLGSGLVGQGVSPWGSTVTSGNYSPSNDPLLKYTSVVDGTQKLNSLALQLQMVARIIATNTVANLGLSRQFFMVSLGGFDTHDNQIRDHAERMLQLDHALTYFNQVLSGMPAGDMRSQVTTFTASEFGRTFTSNGDGTDHGWGAHQFVVGGAVNGTDVYGTFPQYSTADSKGAFSSPDQIENGSLIPSTSVDQYAYTLGKWMGISHGELSTLLPHIGAFNSPDLGFMKS